MGRETATEENLYDFQTRLLEETHKIIQTYRKNKSHTASDATYATLNGTIPPTMVVPVGPTLSILSQESLLSATDEETETNYKFIDLPASIVQMLSPKVEIFKVYKSEEDSELPDRIYPLHQGAHRKEDMIKALRDGDMTAFDDSMQGVVLQAVDFTRLGGNPAEVHTNIKFNIRLYAKSITEFFTRTDAKPEGTLAVDMTEPQREAVIEYTQNIEETAGEMMVRDRARPLREAYADALDIKKVAWIDIIKIDPGQELNANVNAVLSPAQGGAPVEYDPSNPNSSNPQARRDQSMQLVVSERNIRIMARISYTLPENPPTDIHPDAWDDWKRVVSEQKEVFFLSLLGHEFSFLGMQGVELSVDFVAAGNAQALQPSFDLLGGLDFENWRRSQVSAAAESRREADRFRVALRQLQEDVTTLESSIAATALVITQNDAAGASSLSEAQHQAELEQSLQETQAKITRCERGIEILDNNATEEANIIKEVKGIYKAKLLSQIYLNPSDKTPSNLQSRLHYAKVKTVNASASGIELRNLAELSDNYNASIDAWILSSPTEERINAIERGVGPTVTTEGGTGTGVDSGWLDGNFVFLGDIIEAAYETIASQIVHGGVGIQKTLDHLEVLENALIARNRSGAGQNVYYEATKYLTSRNDYYPPLAQRAAADFDAIIDKFDAVHTGRVTFPTPNSSNAEETINIRDIPISYDLFRQWWLGKAESKSFYPLRDFIPDLMMFVTELFQKVKYRDGNGVVSMTSNQLPRFILNNVLFNSTSTSETINGEKKYYYKDTDSFLDWLANSKSSTAGKSTTVIEQADVSNMPSDDVPNIIFGQADKGILKQITFEREDIPGHAEARLMTDRDSVASNIALREKYNVTLEMRGTTSFLPGSVLYLDITPIELGYTNEDNSYAKQLGLGGMYRVVSVQSSLGLDGKGNSWTTRLKTKWESFGDGTNGDPSTSHRRQRRQGLTDEDCS